MRTPTLMFAVASVAMLTGGCAYGMTAEKLTLAREPAGATAHVSTDVRQLSGELIALQDDGLLLVEGKMLRLVPYRRIVSAQFDQTKDKIADHVAPEHDRRERLRVLSRYPQGVSPDLLQDLLRAYGQGELAGIER